MKRGDWVRVTVYMISATDFPHELRTMARDLIVLSVMEGWLSSHVTIGDRIRMVVRIKGGELCLGEFKSGFIRRIEGPYVLSRQQLYQVLKVPPSRKETFSEFA